MAFPTTVTTSGNTAKGCGGPFLSSGGNVYVITKDAAGDGLRAFKATDPATSFSNIGTDFTVVSGYSVNSLAAFQVGDNIHVATWVGTSAAANRIYYHIFSMSSDTWTTTNEAIKGADFATATAQVTGGNNIMVRSDGDVIVSYNGPKVANMGSDRERVYYARREAAVWTVDVLIDNGGATNWTNGGLVIGSSDRTHFFFQDDGADDAYQRTLTSANALETFPASLDASISATNTHFVQRGTSYVSGANTKVRYPFSDSAATNINSAKCDSAAAPTMSVDADIAGATAVTSPAFSKSFAADGTTLWHAFVENVTNDILTQSNADDAGWSAPASFYTGTVDVLQTSIYTRGGDIVLAMVFGETNVKYHEKVLVAGGNVFDLDALATLTGSGASTATSNFSEIAAAVLTASGAATAAGAFQSAAVATLTAQGSGIFSAALQAAAVAVLTAEGKATAAANLLAAAVAVLTAEGRSTATAEFQAAAAATLTANGQATAAAALLAAAAATLTASGQAIASANWSSASVATLTLVGESAAQSAAALQADAVATLTMQGAATATAEFAADAVATLTLQGQSTASAALLSAAVAALTAQGQATAAAALQAAATAVLTAQGATIAAAALQAAAAASLTAQGASTATAVLDADAAATLTAQGAATAAAALQSTATAVLTAQGQTTAAAEFLSSAVAVLSLVGAEINAAFTTAEFQSEATAALTAQGASFAAGAAQIDATVTFILVGAAPGVAVRDYGLPKRLHRKRLEEDDAEIMRIIETALPYLEENYGYH